MNPRRKIRRIGATVRRLREILSTFPDKASFTVNENPSDLLIGYHAPDGTEYRRAYMKWNFLRIDADKFREVLDELKNGHEN